MSMGLDDSHEVVLSIWSGSYFVAKLFMGLDDWLWLMSMEAQIGGHVRQVYCKASGSWFQGVKILSSSMSFE